jgi:hypothetical protein
MKILAALAVLLVFALAVGVGDDTGLIHGYHAPAAAIGHGA